MMTLQNIQNAKYVMLPYYIATVTAHTVEKEKSVIVRRVQLQPHYNLFCDFNLRMMKN
jgi:hypothetical protein